MNNPRHFAPRAIIPEWVLEDLRWFAKTLAINGNESASRKLRAQMERGSGISRTLLRTAWDNTFSGPSGENPPDPETALEAGRVMANIDELARPRVDYGALIRPGYDEPRGPGRPLTAGEPRDAAVQVRITLSERAAVDAARGSETRSDWIRRAILARLEADS